MFNAIKPHLQLSEFKIPNSQNTSDYFPNFLENILNRFVTFYRNSLATYIDAQIKFDTPVPLHNHIQTKIENLSSGIVEAVSFYYQGRILDATMCFNSAMDNVFLHNLKASTALTENNSFFRARCSEGRAFVKSDLFHLPYEKRHLVSTNRYSIPGFPALYLGDSTYVCWEEFNRHRLRDLSFVRFSNSRELSVVQIERLEDFLKRVKELNDEWQMTHLLRFLVTFPITLACTIKVKDNGVFRPEYIIPQLLLQYVSKNDKIDGIQFPSSKVDYSKLRDVKAYNYVFPVKSVARMGYCPILARTFHLSEPTSLEIEEILYNPKHNPGTWMDGIITNHAKIELVEGEAVHYQHTSFGRIEESLRRKNIGSV